MINWEECSDAEVAALARALHEARFADEPNDPLVWTSPVVIDLHVQALAEHERRNEHRRGVGKSDPDPKAGRLWRGRPEESVVVRKLAQDPGLLQWVREDSGQRLRDLVRPFVLDDADVKAILEQVEAVESA